MYLLPPVANNLKHGPSFVFIIVMIETDGLHVPYILKYPSVRRSLVAVCSVKCSVPVYCDNGM